MVSEMNTLRKQSTSGLPVPVCSGRGVARNMGIPKTSVFHILHGVLQLYPCILQSLQQLMPDDITKRMTFVSWALSELRKIPNDSSVSCGQTRLVFHCLEQLTHTTVESEQRKIHMHTQMNS